MGDANKKYMSFWRRHMHRSVSSPSLARKSGKLSKDEISMPFPGDPSGFGPLNSFHGSAQSNSTHFRSAEILSKSQSNVKESRHDNAHFSGSHGKVHKDFCGNSRSKSINHLLKSQEIYGLGHHDSPRSRKSLGSESPETPINPEIVPTDCSDGPSFEIGKTDSKAYNNSSATSEVGFTSCNGIRKPNINNEIDTLGNSTQVAPLRSVNRKESKRLGVLSLGKKSKKQTKIDSDAFTNDDVQTEKKVKHSKRSIFGISFRRKKEVNNPIDKAKGSKKLYEVSEKGIVKNENPEASSPGTSSGKSQENILFKDKYDDLFDYGSPIYEIMTPTEIYERRASIKNLNGVSTPKLPNNQKKNLEKEERYFDFDVDKMNMKIHPETQNNEQPCKSYDAESRIIKSPEVNNMPETNHTPNVNAGDDMSNIGVNSDSQEVNCLSDLSPTISKSFNKSAMISSASEIIKHPDSTRKHQNVSRSRSEPIKARGDLRIHKSLTHTQSEAFSPILDDHLQKHNRKVAAELGIDMPSLRKSDVPAIGGVGNSNDAMGGAAKYSISTKVVKRRPASLTLPEYGKTSEQTSPHLNSPQNNYDRNPNSKTRSLTSDSVTHKTKMSTSSDDLSLPGIQTPNTSTKNQFVRQNSRYQKRDTPGDTRHYDSPLLQSRGRTTDSTDGATAKHHIDTQEKAMNINSSIPTAPPPIIVGAIKKKQQDYTKWSDHHGSDKDSLNPKKEYIRNYDDHSVTSQYDHPLSREATLHPQFDDVFDTSTHPVESSISQKRNIHVREGLYDIPQYPSIQPATRQRSNHMPSANVYDNPGKFKPPASMRPPPTQPSASERDVAKAAVINWATNRLARLPASTQAMYVNQQWHCKVQPKVLYRQPPIYEENSEHIYQVYQPREFKARTYRDPYDSMSFYRSASLERLRPPPFANPVFFANVNPPIPPHYNVPRQLPYPQTALFYPPPTYVPYHPRNVANQYVPFHRSASLDRLGRRPQVQSSVNNHSRSDDIPRRQFHSPQRHRNQPTNPTGFYRTASLDRLGRRTFVRPPLPRDHYLQTPQPHNAYQNYYHQPPVYTNNHQSSSLDRRSRDAAGARSRAYSAAQAMTPPASLNKPSNQIQMNDIQRNYQQPTTI